MSETDNGSSSASKKSIWDLLRFLFGEKENGQWEVKWSTYQGLAIVVGIAMLIIYSASSSNNRWQSLAICLLTAGAALAMGILVGFLFGIPRAGAAAAKLDAAAKAA